MFLKLAQFLLVVNQANLIDLATKQTCNAFKKSNETLKWTVDYLCNCAVY